MNAKELFCSGFDCPSRLFARQSSEEFNEIMLFVFAQVDRLQLPIAEGILAAAFDIELHDISERRGASVMKIRGGQFDIAQRRRAERADVESVPGDQEPAEQLRIGLFAQLS